MIGYYVHHIGHGHLRHAQCIAEALDDDVTGLSSLARPHGWPGDWILLDRDDGAASVADPTASGQLHWAPRGDRGLAARMAQLARWIGNARPLALVVDVSVEVTVFARLMGVSTVVMALPGRRDDPAHQLAYSIADAVIAPWPAGTPGMDRDLHPWLARTAHVGAISRHEGRSRPPDAPRAGRRVLVLQGRGGTETASDLLRRAAAATPGWQWRRLGPGAWRDDPWPQLCQADVVVTHAGLGALADVAVAGIPAIVIPQPRPHREQDATAEALGISRLAVTLAAWPPEHEWPALLHAALGIGGDGWARWRGGGARQAAAVIERVAGRGANAEMPPCASS